ncbi:MAG: hypothetical protein IPL54_05175 [Chitinophagaceae bacterium]|nr:hypothetical protein [Chitinophagaceae bacterium]
MKKVFWTIFALLIFIESEAQKEDDNRIVVTLDDTTNIHQRVRQAVVFTDFIVRDDSKPDSLITYAERIFNSTIFVIAKVVIIGNKVEISGAYGLGYQDFWGFPDWPRGYSEVIYYKESESWKIIRKIALKLDGKLSFYNQKNKK